MGIFALPFKLSPGEWQDWMPYRGEDRYGIPEASAGC
jgi:hypothetical protein